MNNPSLTEILKKSLSANQVKGVLEEYKQLYRQDVETRSNQAAQLNKNYYKLATDFFEYGWGPSFHFGVRYRGESFAASLARHEMYLAHRLNLQPGMKVVDVGSGVGGPMRTIARFSGADIVGINNSTYQIERARQYNREAELEAQCDFIDCDWIDIPVDAGHYDAAYAIETTCIAGHRVRLFKEIHRVLKEGAYFAGYEWCLTSQYDTNNPQHRALKHGIEEGGGIPNLTTEEQVINDFKASGFEILECRDLVDQCSPQTPWYLPLKGEGLSLQTFRQSRWGRLTTGTLLTALERLRIVPQGTTEVHDTLNLCADSLMRAGELGIFTPMLFFYVRKVSDFAGQV